MLFSEPKIPQSLMCSSTRRRSARFSALQRAENSSMRLCDGDRREARTFQCSSASRKFLNEVGAQARAPVAPVSVLFSEPKIPQCAYGDVSRRDVLEVSVLFSEPKIPQSISRRNRCFRIRVSVLFSEPKIPQSRPSHLRPSIFPTATITLRRS